MKVLFVLFYPGFLRYYDSTIRALAERGHTVHVAFSIPEKQSEGLLGLDEADERIVVADRLPKRRDVWSQIVKDVRGMIDYGRYLHPRFADLSYLRDRMEKFLPGYARGLIRVPRLEPWQYRPFMGTLHALERAVPSDPAMDEYVRQIAPDVVIVTPLVNPASQTDVVKSAQALGLRTGAGIASWDNLTTKGLMRIQPDTVIVWNEIQRTEAVELHYAKPEAVCVTGAQPYDRWFERRPSLDRTAFCAKVGLPPDKPFVLFVGSTASISAPDAEHLFVREWIGALRASDDPTVSELGVLIRPHPYNSVEWGQADVSDLRDAAVWPRHGANPVDESDRADYFDSLYHSVAVVGINTSAMIEAAIVGRPVHTIVGEEFADTQGGTVHFHYMLPEHGGFVRVGNGLRDHAQKLAETISRPEIVQQDIQHFLSTFVRPRGLDTPCTQLVADEIERVGALGPVPLLALPFWLRGLRALLLLVALVRSFQIGLCNGFGIRKRVRKRVQRVRKRVQRVRNRVQLVRKRQRKAFRYVRMHLPLSDVQRQRIRRVCALVLRERLGARSNGLHDATAGATASTNGVPPIGVPTNGTATNGTSMNATTTNGAPSDGQLQQGRAPAVVGQLDRQDQGARVAADRPSSDPTGSAG